MRIGCLQFAPQVGDVDNNLNRADAVLNKADPQDLDLLVLPELAFSGYHFKSLEHISPFLEPSGSGISALWARTTALKYDCHVAVGYPEKIDPTNNWPTSPEYYNSSIIVNGDGETVANYRKSHLYHVDETWALEGHNGFFDGYIPELGPTSMGICMDLNPYKFEAPWHEFEFAYHVLECQSNLVIISMAWMTREDGRMFSRMPNEPDMNTLTYWVTRLEPLIRSEDEEQEIIVIFCNRTGTEGESVYAGTSAVVGIQGGEVKVYGVLGRGEKELLVVDTDNTPYAKLIYRPESATSAAFGELQASEPATSPRSARSRQSQPRSRHQSNAMVPAPHLPQLAPQPNIVPTASPDISISQSTSQTKRRERPKPQLQIPVDPSQELQPPSATSTKSTADDIPTPSAPSPTPYNVRPKITIPSTREVQGLGVSPIPMSAQSIQSVQSVQSTTSTTSRPPEDSTPYPHSGAPYGGGPRLGTIYGGDVLISRQGFSPTTPFEDSSPIAMRHGWSTGHAFETMADSEAQSIVGGPSAKQRPRRAFQDWPQLTPRDESGAHRPSSSRTFKTPKTKAAILPKRIVSDRSVPGLGDLHISLQAQSSHINELEEPVSPKPSKCPTRPSSPKSRNASRTGNRERSDSTLALRNIETDIDQLLETIGRRAESTQRSKGGTDAGKASPRQPQTRSSSRPAEVTASIVIGASATVLGPEIVRCQTGDLTMIPRAPRATSRFGQRARSASLSEDNKRELRSRTPNFSGHPAESTSRAVSRGRRPGPQTRIASHTGSDETVEPQRPGSAAARLKEDVAQQVGFDRCNESPGPGSVRGQHTLVSKYATFDHPTDKSRNVDELRRLGQYQPTSAALKESVINWRGLRIADAPTDQHICSTRSSHNLAETPNDYETSHEDDDALDLTNKSAHARTHLSYSLNLPSEADFRAETFVDSSTPTATICIRSDEDKKQQILSIGGGRPWSISTVEIVPLPTLENVCRPCLGS